VSLKPCLKTGCGKASIRGGSYCPTHRPKAWRKRDPDPFNPYATPTWKRLRAEARARANGTCERCGAPGSHADHIIALALGGEFTGPLQWLCTRCHQAKTAQDAKEARRRLRERSR
jgi:5-methylcytosine-specific restriction endonuclease McrA